ncbi:MAG TPA: polysaccharide deacetylase family protein [Bacteroidales bacterium]|jgi:peptidoglycan/xylan/chitin deacetylase (PgdA/CDA1 family)|nr:polysaccharide deacetylase family protein [Bacteroidales bacterium]HNR41377.1 polysaccharide deacetylase family protein [Bacteroidales bacterium]HPM17501.1 polysaccharide deacetylase family protein [Bacteroidales bacterium]HQH24690.1 polysaccharide deacetylase family protein [Bacteroidales bacterium]
MRQYRPFFLIRKIFTKAIFRIPTDEKLLCLTFDDGPHPDSTVAILDILDKYQVKATFFLTGANAVKYPGVKDMITAAGHMTGNHGYRHISGWKTSSSRYADNVSRAAGPVPSRFYRPPYGRLTLRQYNQLIREYIVVFWDLMPYDFSGSQSAAKCLSILRKRIRPGSIIVLHDSPDSKVTGFLAEFIEYASGEGYRFVTIDHAMPGTGMLRKTTC